MEIEQRFRIKTYVDEINSFNDWRDAHDCKTLEIMLYKKKWILRVHCEITQDINSWTGTFTCKEWMKKGYFEKLCVSAWKKKKGNTSKFIEAGKKNWNERKGNYGVWNGLTGKNGEQKIKILLIRTLDLND